MRAQTKFWQVRDAEVENIYLTSKNEELESEMGVVKWYIDVFEDGQDTRQIVKLYAVLKKKHNDL